MSELRLRHSVRALIVDEVDRVLLCRWDMAGMTVWGTPGGGIEEGESHLAALRRELFEEVGLTLETECHHVWHQEVVPAQHAMGLDDDYFVRWWRNWMAAPYHAAGYDGVINDFYLVRTSAFEPRVTLSDDQRTAADLTELRWWPLDEITAYVGNVAFAPRFLAPLLNNLLGTFSDGNSAPLLDIGL